MKDIYLLGIGRGTPIFIELAEACGYNVVGLYHYIDGRTGEYDHGIKILGSFKDLFTSDIHDMNFALTMGDMSIKYDISKKILNNGGKLPSLIYPNVIISRFAKISDCGVLICSNCEVHPDAIINEGCVMWPQVIVEHNTTLGEYVFCGPKAYVGAGIDVKTKAFIGQCAVCMSGKVGEIGESALIGAGSVVTKPVPANYVVKGNPARTYYPNNES